MIPRIASLGALASAARGLTSVSVCAVAVGCLSDATGSLASGGDAAVSLECGLDARYWASPTSRDGIPSIDDPRWVPADHPVELDYLQDDDHVVGLTVRGRAYAVPVNILWYHEIVNASFPTPDADLDLAITHCPLTGTSMVFDRAAIDGRELGVSGLLYQSNLVMYDRSDEQSLWPQMLGEATCGPRDGAVLALYPSIEMTWSGWLALHPGTEVLAGPSESGAYAVNPYAGYDRPTAEYTFPMPPLDARLLPKARVLGVATGEGDSWVFPFDALEAHGPYGVVSQSFGPDAPEAVVLWDRARGAASAFHGAVDGEALRFRADDDGFHDLETGTRWTVDGLAVEGPLEGERLDIVDRSYVGFWGVWEAFFARPRIWGQHGPAASG